MTYAGSYGIYSETVTGPLFLDANAASYSGSVGIRVDNTSGASITNNTSHHNGFHGIGLTFSSNNTIAKNTCYANLKPSIRSAVGIDIDQSSNDNLIQANTLYSNQDSGSNVRGGSTRNLFVRNLSYRNGDHGYDTRNTTGNTYISNTSYRNFKDGFSIEGNANYTVLADNIAVDNGLTSNEYNLYVDGTSTTGFSSDYDLFWNSSPGVSVRFDLVSYPTFSDFKTATGYDPHGLDADPLFVDAAANDFHLRAASPALDSADSS